MKPGTRKSAAIKAVRWNYSAFVVASLVLTSCAILARNDLPLHRATPSIASELVDRSLITGEPCGPPCWQGIIPGETTEEEVMTILGTLFFVDGGTIRAQGNRIYWDSDIENWPGGTIVIGDDGIVERISYGLPYYLELQDLIDLEGEPDGFYGASTRNADGGGPVGYDLVLFWLGDGFRATFVTDYDGNPRFCGVSPLNPEMQVWDISYFEPAPSIQEYAEREYGAYMISLIEDGLYHEWNDYQPIDCEP